MAIVGQNALLNQYVPTFYIKDLRDGQTIRYDSIKKAFINADGGGGGGGATRLGELTDVNPTVDNPLSVQNGQALVYNSFTSLWENKFVDYNTLLNKPTSSSFSFAGLSDTAKPSLPDGYVKWNSAGTQLVYSTTIPAASITGLATVATTGNYNDLINKPTITNGTVTTVSVVTANGVSGTVANPTTTPAITLVLGNITPTSVASTGTVTGSNLTGVNTGDQTIILSGDVTGVGTSGITTTLATVNSTVGTFGSSTLVPIITVDAKGRITNVTTTSVGNGTVTSVNVSGGTTGLTTSGGPITNSGTITLGGTLGIANGGTGATTASAAANNLLPSQTGNNGKFLSTNGSNVSWVSTGLQNVSPNQIVYGDTTPGTIISDSTFTYSAGIMTVGSVITSTVSSASGFPLTLDGKSGLVLKSTSGVVNLQSELNTNGSGGTVGQSLVSRGPGLSPQWVDLPTGSGTVTSVSTTGTQGVTALVVNGTTNPAITIGLGAITPTSVAATGTVTGTNLSGTNTGDQTIALTGDVTGSGTGTFAATLATVNATPGTYADAHFVPTITVNAKGLVTSITTQHVDTTVRDLVDVTDVFTVAPRHQYIVTSQLEIDGMMVNNGVIAIL